MQPEAAAAGVVAMAVCVDDGVDGFVADGAKVGQNFFGCTGAFQRIDDNQPCITLNHDAVGDTISLGNVNAICDLD